MNVIVGTSAERSSTVEVHNISEERADREHLCQGVNVIGSGANANIESLSGLDQHLLGTRQKLGRLFAIVLFGEKEHRVRYCG